MSAPAMTATSSTLRPELPALPERIVALPVHRGYPVPWFVPWVDGVPEFRAMDGAKLEEAVVRGLCWVCGQRLGAHRAFTIGPMCAVNRISAEPPSHRECAEFSARACPFLSRPTMRRREGDVPDGMDENRAGGAILRNPGVALVWLTKDYRVLQVKGGLLFRIGAPRGVACYAAGRPASVEEIAESFYSGLPLLAAEAREQKIPPQQLVQDAARGAALLGIIAPRPADVLAAVDRIRSIVELAVAP